MWKKVDDSDKGPWCDLNYKWVDEDEPIQKKDESEAEAPSEPEMSEAERKFRKMYPNDKTPWWRLAPVKKYTWY